jgi:hypothetical protein
MSEQVKLWKYNMGSSLAEDGTRVLRVLRVLSEPEHKENKT